MNISLTDDEFSSGNQSETSNSEKYLNYIAFIFIVKNESRKGDEKVENLEETDSSQEELEDWGDIQEAYDQLFVESLKLKMLNGPPSKKLHDLELEKERLVVKLMESTRSVISLNVGKEFLENKVRLLWENLRNPMHNFALFLVHLRSLTIS